MSIKLADTLQPMADFPSAYAKDIAFDDGDTLQEKLDTGSLGGDGASYKQLSQAEYDALTEDEKLDGREYRTYDTGHIYKLGVEYGKDGVQISDNETVESENGHTVNITDAEGVKSFEVLNGKDGVQIDDETTSTDTVWSSKKTSDEIAKVETELNASLGELCNKKIYCGEVMGTIVDGYICTSNPIGKVGNVIATIKYQSNLAPRGYSVTAQTTLKELNFYFRWHRDSDDAEAYPPDGIELTISYMIFY